MSLYAHLDTLQTKHNALETQIAQAYRLFVPDATVTELKKQKLRIKEEMQRVIEEMELADAKQLRKNAA